MITYLKKLINISYELGRWSRAFYSLEILFAFWVFTVCFPNAFDSVSLFAFILGVAFFQFSYYAVYIINDLLDYEKDKKDPNLSHKPLLSGKISFKDAWIVAILHIVIGVGLLFAFKFYTFGLLTIFILAYNFIYTTVLKKNKYVRIFANGFTHLFRVIIPIILFNPSLFSDFNYIYVLLLLWIAYAWSLTLRRRMDNVQFRILHKVLPILVILGALAMLFLNICILVKLVFLLVALLIFSLEFLQVISLKKMKEFYIKTKM